MTRFEHCGGIFDEKTDWFRFLQDVTQGRSSYGLAPDLDTRSGLGELYEALKGTPLRAAMASAALELVENGTREERKMMRSVPYQEAPGARERLLRLILQKYDELGSDFVWGILYRLLEKYPGDRETTAMLQRELEQPNCHPDYLALAARHLPDWLIQNLPLLRPSPPINGMDLLALLVRVPESKQQALLDSIAALGKPYVDALSSAAANPGLSEVSRRHKVAILEAHPVFHQALAEALSKSSA